MVDSVDIFKKISKFYPYSNNNDIVICNDSVIFIQDIENVFYSLEDIITNNFLFTNFTKNEIKEIKNIKNQLIKEL